ncbi:MAG: DUF2905 domain-containing protein [Gemmatimonadales bacterium]
MRGVIYRAMNLTRIPVGLVIAGAGLLLVVVGLLVWAGAFSWFGRLPGDIRIERPGVRFYFPLVSMIIVSIVLSLLIGLVQRLTR